MAASPGQTTAQSAPGSIRSVAARKGTQREYETVLILRPSQGKAEILALVERMQRVFAERKAKLLRIDNWGVRTLAFQIKRESKGIYLYWRFVGGSDIVAEFERNLRNLEGVLRYYTVRVDDDVDPDARPSEVTEELLDVASNTGPDPEEEARKAAREARERADAEAKAAAAEAAAQAAAAAAAAAEALADEADGGTDAEKGEE